jgi:hypothetical protein
LFLTFKKIQVFSHQSQLPQKKSKVEKTSLKRTRSSRTIVAPSADMYVSTAEIDFADDVFGLTSLSDAALKVCLMFKNIYCAEEHD